MRKKSGRHRASRTELWKRSWFGLMRHRWYASPESGWSTRFM